MTIRPTRHLEDGGATLVIEEGDAEWGRFYDKAYWESLVLLKKVLATLEYALRSDSPQMWIDRAKHGLSVYMNRMGDKINVRDYGGAASKYMMLSQVSLAPPEPGIRRYGPDDSWKNTVKAAIENLRGQIDLHTRGGGGVPLDVETIR